MKVSSASAMPLSSADLACCAKLRKRWRQRNAVLGATLVVGLIYVALNLLADLLYRLLDPRVA